MDTKSFLEEILPAEGYIVLAEFKTNQDGSKYIVHHFYTDFETAAEAALEMDAKGSEVYHACATYLTDQNRKQNNVKAAKCFWLDIDVGKSDSYGSQREAAGELGAVCSKLGLKMPMMVSSGRGLHCYWVFTDAIDIAVWKTSVAKFRTALDSLGFKHDPARTTDQASILRPVGSTWRKNGDRTVRLISQGSRMSFLDIMAGIDKYLGENSLSAPQRKQFPIFEVERLTEKQEYPPSSAVIVASMCQQVGRMRDMKGSIPEPEWRNAIGVIKHSVEGNDLCHEWSKGDLRYDAAETQNKIDGWQTGPTTCATFEATNPHLCASCKFKGKVTSPIQLGYTAEAKAPELKQPDEVSLQSVDYAHNWPKNFEWNDSVGKLSRLVKDADGIPAWEPFCDTLFYPTTRVQMEDGTFAMRYTMQVNKNKWRQFEVPTKLLASQDGFAAALASYEIIIHPKKGFHAMSYTQAWLEKFKQNGVEINTFKHYGWHDNYTSFLFGDRLMTSDGVENQVIRATNITPGSRLDTDFTNFVSNGSPAKWADIFNDIYNRPGAEAYQFTALALMVSPLVALFDVDNWNGIPVAMTGEGGQGKTSVGMAACSIYGRGKSFVFDTKNSTMNAFDPFVGCMHNLPCVLDELTGRDPSQVSDKLYALSNGGGRDRADQKGNMSAIRHSWKLISLITGNTNITESMHQLEKQRADASSVRIFEISINADNGGKLFDGINVPEMLNLMQEHYGEIGRLFIKAAAPEKARLREAFLKMRSKLGYESATYDTRERFFIDLIATAYVGGILLKNMNFIRFDLKRVTDWAMNHIMEMRMMRSENTYGVEEQLAAFFGFLSGHILATKDVSRSVVETPMESYRLFGDVKARIAHTAKRVIVSSRAMDEWCVKQAIAPRTFRRQLKENGFLKTDAPEKFTLAVGTNLPSAQERVVEFVFDRVINAADKANESAKVVQIR